MPKKRQPGDPVVWKMSAGAWELLSWTARGDKVYLGKRQVGRINHGTTRLVPTSETDIDSAEIDWSDDG